MANCFSFYTNISLCHYVKLAPPFFELPAACFENQLALLLLLFGWVCIIIQALLWLQAADETQPVDLVNQLCQALESCNTQS
jgi:hypothetical protein